MKNRTLISWTGSYPGYFLFLSNLKNGDLVIGSHEPGSTQCVFRLLKDVPAIEMPEDKKATGDEILPALRRLQEMEEKGLVISAPFSSTHEPMNNSYWELVGSVGEVVNWGYFKTPEEHNHFLSGGFKMGLVLKPERVKREFHNQPIPA